ncbi:EF-hand domain-containing protein [Pseudomonas frederiksbergensis]|uniref:Calcium-binding protein n=1 Tax=Pseudomonas frederiksbergensis TaxID=104087 RepID=A0A423KK62_9PSED|nr:EF-hand domain-containing protein [Pseudomonas frederiksbergensis]RON53673.1 calcium-binding protein [Pseudomonas frederiksbergensis]
MIGSVSSNYTSYTSTSTSSTTANAARRAQFQKELFTKLDSNGDGSVSQDELKTAQSDKPDNRLLADLSKNFTDLDSDDSGSLSSEEMAAMAPPAPPQDQAPNTDLADALLGALDADGDGNLSSDELSHGLTAAGSSADSKEIFSALDKNQDGSVSSDELKAALQAGREQNSDSATVHSNVSEAINKMIANLTKQYSLDNVASAGKYLNVST